MLVKLFKHKHKHKQWKPSLLNSFGIISTLLHQAGRSGSSSLPSSSPSGYSPTHLKMIAHGGDDCGDEPSHLSRAVSVRYSDHKLSKVVRINLIIYLDCDYHGFGIGDHYHCWMADHD